MGDWSSCEEMYVKYTKIIENNLGEDSFEAGDSYFAIGVLYLNNVMLTTIKMNKNITFSHNSSE